MFSGKAATGVKIKAKIIRKDGRIEERGVICGSRWEVLKSKILYMIRKVI